LITFIFAFSGCGAKSDKEKVTLLLDWEPNVNHTGIFVADKLNFFEEEGIEVEIKKSPENGVIPIVGAGKAEFGIDFQDTLSAAFINDIPVTSVAAIVNHNTSGIISLKNNNISRPKDISNKTFGTSNSPIEQASIRFLVDRDGGNSKSVKMIPTSSLDVISSLSLDVNSLWVFYAQDVVPAIIKNQDVNFFYLRDYDKVFDFYTPVIISNNNFLKNKPEVAKAFLRAVSKGYEYAINHPYESAEILISANPGLEKDIVYNAQEYISCEYKSDNEKWGYTKSERWNDYYQWLWKNNLIKKEIPKDFGFTNNFLN
jgi:ABC-type nitrate/sulfonate/bicarbonate transport system substrate-binding protein